MNRIVAGSFAMFVVFLCCLFATEQLRPKRVEADSSDVVLIEGTARHIVTKAMTEASVAMVEREAPMFEAFSADGQSYKLAGVFRRGPVVLNFVKDGCPCSDEAQSFFNEVHAAYPSAQFFGVIDVKAEKAARWARRFRVGYPLLLDPSCQIMRAYRAENSAYAVLIDSHGRIVKHWPGYSAGMLREMGSTLATLTGTPEQSLKIAAAPEEEYSGCPFDLNKK